MSNANADVFRIHVLATGGTIEKTYDPARGALTLDVPVLEDLMAGLSHPDMAITIERLMAIDSLDMSADHRQQIVATTRAVLADASADAIVITHGTDTLADTAAELVAGLGQPAVPVVLTGAMVPWRVAASDAAQNIAQALVACRLVAPGVHVVFHSRVIPGACVAKDYERLTMIETPSHSS